MNETVKAWVDELNEKLKICDDKIALIDAEIEDATGTFSNEMLWAKGSDSADDVAMHLNNMLLWQEYREYLVRIKNTL